MREPRGPVVTAHIRRASLHSALELAEALLPCLVLAHGGDSVFVGPCLPTAAPPDGTTVDRCACQPGGGPGSGPCLVHRHSPEPNPGIAEQARPSEGSGCDGEERGWQQLQHRLAAPEAPRGSGVFLAHPPSLQCGV